MKEVRVMRFTSHEKGLRMALQIRHRIIKNNGAQSTQLCPVRNFGQNTRDF